MNTINIKQMRPTFIGLVIIGLFIFNKTAYAQSYQPCIVKEYNEELAKTPLAGVEVSADDAGQRVSDAQGKLTLRFLTKNVGDRVKGVKTTKLGYEVFNTDAIAQWNISGKSRPFIIVMCKSERLKKIKDNYNSISSTSYAKQKRKEELLLERELRAGKLKEAEYKRKLQILQDEFDKQEISVRPYIDHFARIDLSELSNQEQNIVRLVKSGEIDRAISLYKRMHLEERFKENRTSFKKLHEASTMISEAIELCNEQRDTILHQIRCRNDVLMMQGGKENLSLVEKSLKEIAENDTTYLYGLSAYSEFLADHHRYRERVRYLHLMARCCEQECYQNISSIYSDIASNYFFLNENDSANIYIAKSLDANETYNRNEPTEYLTNLSTCYITLAQIYNNEGDLQNAEKTSEKGLEYAQQLYSINKKHHASLLKMAILFAISFNQSKSDLDIEALQNQYNDLLFSQENDKDDIDDMDILFGTLGRVNQYLQKGKTDNAKRCLKDTIYKILPLYEKDEQRYRNVLGLFYFSLGSLYYNEEDFSQAHLFLSKGKQLVECEYEINHSSQTIEPIIIGLTMLGETNSHLGYREEADSLFERALSLCNYMATEGSIESLVVSSDDIFNRGPIKPYLVKSAILYSQFEHLKRYGDNETAINALEEKVRTDSIIKIHIPDSLIVPNEWIGRYELSKLYYERDKFEDSKRVLLPCLTEYSDDITKKQMEEVYLLFIDLLVKTKDYNQALELMKYMKGDDEIFKTKMQHYQAICLDAIGQKNEAIKIWNSIQGVLPTEVYENSPLKHKYNLYK